MGLMPAPPIRYPFGSGSPRALEGEYETLAVALAPIAYRKIAPPGYGTLCFSNSPSAAMRIFESASKDGGGTLMHLRTKLSGGRAAKENR